MDDYALRAYDYDLPAERIAQRPEQVRDAARLMVLRQGGRPEHRVFRELPEILTPGDLLVRNDTRVIPARLRGQRPGGGKIEVLLVRPAPGEAEERRGAAGSAEAACHWLCLARPAAHLKVGKTLVFGEGDLRAEVVRHLGQGMVELRFIASAVLFRTALEKYGEVPLPPYIRRPGSGPDADDRERYQTVYARHEGAVAAPTAGLHFTAELDKRLCERGVRIAYLTLHVGPGTFRPLLAEDIRDHKIDAEVFHIPAETAEAWAQARAAGRRIIAVGTTVVRALESAVNEDGVIRAGSGCTELFIMPGHRFGAITGMVTNFHLPRSSLLVMVSAFYGRERILAAYAEAIATGYRFYSYGDAMLIIP